jgi:hypothetical protein
MQNSPLPPENTSRGRLLAMVLIPLVALLGIWIFISFREVDRVEPHQPATAQKVAPQSPVSPDQQRWQALLQSSAYLNVRPGVNFVDDATCADCHAEIADAFARHPMGRSLAPTPEASPIEQYTAEKRHPLKTNGFEYQVRRDGARQFHQEIRLSPTGTPALTQEFEALFSVGSGRTGRSYIIERDGHLFMSPLTWYAEYGWDLSPGYEVNNSHFNRPVVSECLFCHSNRYQHVEGTLNAYSNPVFSGYAIGCQRCHGPGELHVAAQQAGTPSDERDTTIVNPAHLAPELRESVCQQCHLGGLVRAETAGRRREDFRPGLPWHAVEAVYVAAGKNATGETPAAGGDKDPDRFIGHVEQMHLSGCYAGSDGKLGCISCHDPHRLPEESAKVAFYRDRCLRCHGETDCSLPPDVRRQRNSDDSCYACHMPRAATQIRHAAATDHRIPRSPGVGGTKTPSPDPAWSPLVSFRSLIRPATAEESGKGDAKPSRPDANPDRNLAVALVRVIDRYPTLMDAQQIERTQALLQQMVSQKPDDIAARDAYAFVLARGGQLPEALQQMEEVIRRQPRSESYVAAAASMLMHAQNWAGAASLWEQARGLNPWIVRYWSKLALCYARLARWDDCGELCETGIQRFPDSFGLRQLLIESLLIRGRTGDASREYDRLIELNPPKLDSVRRWWDNHPGRKGGPSPP